MYVLTISPWQGIWIWGGTNNIHLIKTFLLFVNEVIVSWDTLETYFIITWFSFEYRES